MRAWLTSVVVAVAVAGCNSDPLPTFTCQTDPQCFAQARPGICVDKNTEGTGVCATADSSCPSGYRYDDSAGKDRACYVFPDGAEPPDFAQPPPPDMSVTPPDMTEVDMVVPVPDLSMVDLAQEPFAWYAEAAPTGVTGVIRAVWGTPDGQHVYAVAQGPAGMTSAGALLHSTGNGVWEKQTTGLPTAFYPNNVWGSSAGDVYVVGGTGPNAVMWRSTGDGTWTAVTNLSSYNGNLFGLSGTGASAIYAGGTLGRILHWTGGANWTQETCGSTSNDAHNSIFAIGTVAYSAGNGGSICYTTGNGTWTPQASNTAATNMTAVWGSSVTDLHAIGYKFDSATNTTTRYYTRSNGGGTWTAGTLPTTANPNTAAPAPFGTDGTNIYLAGSGGYLFKSSGGGNWTAERIVTSTGVAVTQDLWGVWGNGPRNVYVVGAGGVILHGK